MSNDTVAEARSVISAAKALLRELSEEGLETFAREAEHEKAASVIISTSPRATVPKVGAAQAKSICSAASTVARTPQQPSSHVAPVATQNWDNSVTLDVVRKTLGDCQRCDLAGKRTQIVFGEGNPNADILFVGEAPGEQEDLRGIPFCGPAGDLLTNMIEKGMQIPRSSVYICNIVKCRPPLNRTPLDEEVAACRPFLDGQIRAVKPKVIVALGKPAASLLFGRSVLISRERGRWTEYCGIPVMPTFHPAYLLRRYTLENRRLVWEDLQTALAKAKA